MDKFAFANLISWLSKRTDYLFSKDDCETINHAIAEGMPQELVKADPEAIAAMLLAIKEDKKIEAIKAYRALTGFGLKDSKDAIEANWITNADVQKAAIINALERKCAGREDFGMLNELSIGQIKRVIEWISCFR